MTPELNIYPAIAMFALTLGIFFAMGIGRYRAIHRGEVKISHYQTYTKGQQPERLLLLARHVQNLFEVPPLFYIACLFCFVTGAVNAWSLGFAWAFFISRCVHSFVHLSKNNVSQRFFVFGFSLMVLCGLWASLLVHLLR